MLTAEAKKFREEIGRQLRAVIVSKNLKVKAAATALGVSRQAFHQYLSARATPHPETIARAMDLWHIEPTYKGEKIARGALGEDKRHDSRPTQLSFMNLFDVPQACENENLVVTVQSSRDSVLHVTIKMKKADGPRPHRTPRKASKTG
jgi:transcriptional regulator with XRE-family HTH domain